MTTSPDRTTAPVASHVDLAELAHNVVADCLDPPRPEQFARFCSDERARFLFAAVAAAFPDARLQVGWVTADRDRVVLGGRFQGTHLGPWRGLDPTGRRFDVMAMMMFAVIDGSIVSTQTLMDSFALAEQLGAVTPLAPKACEIYEARAERA